MKLLNLYQGFREILEETDAIEDRMHKWESYMEKHYSIKYLMIDDYEEENIDWQKYALENVFDYEQDTINKMDNAANLIEQNVAQIILKLQKEFDLQKYPLTIIIYHGLGNAAGMIEKYHKKPALFFGVEKIVSLGWDEKTKLEDLVAHEFGHLIHMKVRRMHLEPYQRFKRKYIFKTYTEGMATYIESFMNGRKVSMPKWYEEAQSKESLLKQEFLKRLEDKDESINDFFGDWYPVEGIIEAGYYLGMKLIEELVNKYTIKEIMLLEYKTIKKETLKYLKKEVV
jgi:hypothetical protein